ncbi:MAG: right-handed parallel beta-helix repeat-containing protein [Parvularculaceae bacterium]
MTKRLNAAPLLSAILSVYGAAASAADGPWLEKEIQKAKSGATVQIPAGVHILTDLKLYKSVALVGSPDGKTVLRSAEVTEKGILVPLSGVDLKVENITFEGARSWDRNGAGIRHEGRNLTIVNCRFISNEDGLLATGDAGGTITIRNSAFIDNGFGDGMSHAIYVLNSAKLDIDKSRFEGTRIGHHVKSLADETIVRNSVLDDGYGRGSYALDASKGGAVTFEGNTVTQAADGENNTIINYDLTRGGKALKLTIVGNKFINRWDGGTLLRNDSKLTPTYSNNEIVNEGKRPLNAPKQSGALRN